MGIWRMYETWMRLAAWCRGTGIPRKTRTNTQHTQIYAHAFSKFPQTEALPLHAPELLSAPMPGFTTRAQNVQWSLCYNCSLLTDCQGQGGKKNMCQSKSYGDKLIPAVRWQRKHDLPEEKSYDWEREEREWRGWGKKVRESTCGFQSTPRRFISMVLICVLQRNYIHTHTHTHTYTYTHTYIYIYKDIYCKQLAHLTVKLKSPQISRSRRANGVVSVWVKVWRPKRIKVLARRQSSKQSDSSLTHPFYCIQAYG